MTTNSNSRTPSSRFMWAGFVEGEIDLIASASGDPAVIYGILYRTRKEARRLYNDVRKVYVVEVRRGR